jgi:Chitobiase/beta-hexosaminidase C-terminal domain
MFRAFLAVAAMTVAATGCGSTGECETGTVRSGYACYPVDPDDRAAPLVTVDPPVRTPQVGTVRLTTNEPATIYYSFDGTVPTKLGLAERDHVVIPDLPDDATVSFFAVDLNGNRSPTQTVAWQIDRNGPGTPTSFTLTLAGTQRSLAWVMPSDPQLRGVVVARVEGPLNFSPERGKKYNPGETPAPGVQIVAVVAWGNPGAFSEDVTTHTPGLVRYAAWSFDDLRNYGSPANAYAVETLPTQTASVSVDSATGAVTVSGQPANIALAGSAVLDGSTLTVNLDVTNNSSRVLFAPKLLLTTPPAVGSFNSDGTYDTFGYRALGGALLPGVKSTTTIRFDGVTSGDILAMSFEIRNNPSRAPGTTGQAPRSTRRPRTWC